MVSYEDIILSPKGTFAEEMLLKSLEEAIKLVRTSYKLFQVFKTSFIWIAI